MKAVKNAVDRFHANQFGNEAVQTIGIVGVAAMILIVLLTYAQGDFMDLVKDQVSQLFS